MDKVTVYVIEDVKGDMTSHEYVGDYNLNLNSTNALIITETIDSNVVGLDGKVEPPEVKVVAIFHPHSWDKVEVTNA